jgi:membrane-associated protease RseP (regulator of RpoE activity)
MGAVIAQQESATDRRKLLDIAAAGPLAGLVVAVPVLIYGLGLSEVRSTQGIGMQEGNSLLYALLKFAVKGEWLPNAGRDVQLHPTAWAGWAGLLLTMINLIPIGQLDGGHIATAYFGNRYVRVARLIHKAMPWLAIAVFGWVFRVVQRDAAGQVLPWGLTPFGIAVRAGFVWLGLFGMLWLMGRMLRGLDHPPVDDASRLPRSRSALFWLVAAVFVAIFMPVPLRMSVGARPPPPAAAPAEAPR